MLHETWLGQHKRPNLLKFTFRTDSRFIHLLSHFADKSPPSMKFLTVLVAAVASLSAHVSAQNFQHSCYSESSHISSRRHSVSQGDAWSHRGAKGKTDNLGSLDYYLDNGVADGTHELYLEAFCSGGTDEEGNERSRICTRMKLDDCYKNVNGALKAYDDGEEPSDSLSATCEVDSCAIMRDSWDGPVMTCQCRNDNGDFVDTTIDMSKPLQLCCITLV